MNDLVLNLRIRANADGTAQVLGQTSDGIRRVSTESGNASTALRHMDSAASGLMRTIAPLVGIYELISFGKKVVEDTATVQDLNTRLHTLTATAGDYAQTVGYINTVADAQHKKINELSGSYAQLRNLQNSGLVTGQRTKEFFEGLNNAASALGVGNDQLKQTFFGLSQSLGMLNAENFNQVMEPIPGLLQAMDTAAKLPAGGFKNLVNEGKATVAFFSDTLAKALHTFDGAAAATANNINAKTTDISNSWTRLITTFEKPVTADLNPVLDGIKAVLVEMNQLNPQAVIEGIVTVGEIGAAVYGVQMVKSLATYIAAKQSAMAAEAAHNAAITENIQRNIAGAQSTVNRLDVQLGYIRAQQAAVAAEKATLQSTIAASEAVMNQARATLIATEAMIQNTSIMYIRRQALASMSAAEAGLATTTLELAAAQQRQAILSDQIALSMTAQVAATRSLAAAQASATAAAATSAVTLKALLVPMNLVNLGLAGLVGWEIGKWLNSFETVRITATATLGAILQGLENVSYYWDRLQIALSKSGNKDARLAMLKEGHLAAKKAIDDNIVSTIAYELNGRKAAESANQLAASNTSVAVTASQSTKEIKEVIKELEQQIKYQTEIAKVTNASIDAQIKDLDRLNTAKAAGLDAERKANDFAYEQHKLSAQAYLDTELALIDKATQAKVDALNQQAALQKTKLDEQVTDVDKAYEAIRMIESKGQAGQVNKSTFALGQGQVLPSTLAAPGFGMSAYTDTAAIDKIKGDYNALVDYVKSHETELANWGKSYFEHLAVYYKSIPEAVKHYGDGTDAYMSKFMQHVGLINGSTINQIKLAGEQKDIEAEIAKVVADGQAQKTAALQKSTTESQTYVRALEDERVKLLELTGEATRAREAKAALTLDRNPAYKQAVVSGNAADVQTFKDVNTAELLNANTAAANAYQDRLDAINKSTHEIGITSTQAFDTINKGFGGLVGTFNSLTDSIDKASAALVDNAKQARDAANDKSLDPQQRITLATAFAAKENALEADRVKTAITGSRQIASAFSEMLDKNSSEYKAAHALEMGLAGAELAMQIMKITGIGAVTAANTESVIPYVGATMTKAEADATAGVAAQGQAGPFIGLALMAVMAAAMAGLGLMSGKSSVASMGPQGMSADTGTVLGDSSAKSQSIDNTYQLLKDIQAENYPVLKSIDQGIADLHSGITDVITRLFQAGGLSTVNAPANGFKPAYGPVGSSTYAALNVANFGMGLDPVSKFLFNGIFGGKQTSSVTAQGISTGPTSITDIMAGKNLQAQQFAQIETKTDGGWFGKDKYSTSMQYAALDASTQKALNDVFKSMGSTMNGLADNLGMGLSDRVKNYIIPALNVDLKGLSGEDAAKKLNGVISSALDTMSTRVFGDILGQYQQLGEGMLETAVRIVSEVAIAKDALGNTGTQFSGDIIAISDALVQASGGLNGFQKNLDNYYSVFFTDTERNAISLRSMNAQLAAVNVVLPKTSEGYRKLVESLNLSNAADAQRYAILMANAQAAGAYYQVLQNNLTSQRALDIQSMTLAGNAIGALAAKRADELAAMNASLRPTQIFVNALTDANTAISKAASNLTAAVGNLKTLAGAINSAMQSTNTSAAMTLQRHNAAQAVLESAQASAKNGQSLDAFPGLTQALLDIAKPSEQLYSNAEDYAKAQAATATILAGLSNTANDQVDYAQRQLDAANGTTDAVYTVRDALNQLTGALTGKFAIVDKYVSTIATKFTATKTAYDKANSLAIADRAAAINYSQTDVAPKQAAVNNLSATYGNLNAVQSSNIALRNSYQALMDDRLAAARQRWNDGKEAKGEMEDYYKAQTNKAAYDAVISAAQPMLNQQSALLSAATAALSASSAKLANLNALTDAAVSAAQAAYVPYSLAAAQYSTVAKQLNLPKIPGFATGGDHDGGWRWVGENGPELEYTGPSHIYNNAQSKAMSQPRPPVTGPRNTLSFDRAPRIFAPAETRPPAGGNSTDDMAAEIKLLRAELKAANIAIAQNTQEMALVLRRWNGQGMPETRNVTA
ncbi:MULTISPECIES: tape measure protein [Methylobacter]